MLYQLLYGLRTASQWLSGLNVLRYTSTRIILGTLTAMLITLLLYPAFIRALARSQLGQVVREDGPQSHLSKRGTPTMGGSLIIFAVVIPTILWADPENPYILLSCAVTVAFGIIGFLDDYLKIRRKHSGGLSAKVRLAAEFAVTLAVVAFLNESGMVPEHLRNELPLDVTPALDVHDKRVKAVFAMAPGILQAFGMDAAGLRQLTVSTYITVGAGDTQAPPKDNAEFAARHIAHAELDVMPGRVDHDIFVNECNDDGKDEFPQACIDAPGIDRRSIHARIGEAAVKFFDASLNVPRGK